MQVAPASSDKDVPLYGWATRLTTCTTGGITFQNAYQRRKPDASHGNKTHQHPTVIKYDFNNLFRRFGVFRVLFTNARLATASHVCLTDVVWNCLMFGLILGVLHLTDAKIKEESVDAMLGLVGYLTGATSFILSLFVGTSVARWWSMRDGCVGGLWGAVDDLCLWAAAWFAGPSGGEAQALNLRYGLASYALLYKQARGEDDDLVDLVSANLLTPDEAATLAPLPSKPQVVWAWLTAFWYDALSVDEVAKSATTPPIRHAQFLAPMVMEKCAAGRGSIGAALTYVDTQQPFAYVHLLGMLCHLMYLANSIAIGLDVARLTVDVESPDGISIMVDCIRLLMVPIYFGSLLSVGIVLENPLGTDHCDFPELAYGTYMNDECEAFRSGVRGWLALRKKSP